MVKCICQKCWKMHSIFDWGVEHDEDWEKGIIMCPGKMWRSMVVDARDPFGGAPKFCPWVVEHLVLDQKEVK